MAEAYPEQRLCEADPGTTSQGIISNQVNYDLCQQINFRIHAISANNRDTMTNIIVTESVIQNLEVRLQCLLQLQQRNNHAIQILMFQMDRLLQAAAETGQRHPPDLPDLTDDETDDGGPLFARNMFIFNDIYMSDDQMSVLDTDSGVPDDVQKREEHVVNFWQMLENDTESPEVIFSDFRQQIEGF